MSARKSSATPLSFEDSLRQLETIVKRLEEEEIPLDEALKLFAEGQRLRQSCDAQLRAKENEVRRLLESADGTIEEAPFETSGAVEGADEEESEEVGGSDENGRDTNVESEKPSAPAAASASAPKIPGRSKDDLPF